MKKISLLLSISIWTLLFTSGCFHPTHPKTIEEIFQIPKTTKVYTANNIWYKNPKRVSAMNYQEGKRLKLGTEVEFLKIKENYILFKTRPAGKIFKIIYPRNWMQQPIESYLKQTFTTKTPEQIELEHDALAYEKISRGIVERGMTKADVLAAYGYPVIYKTPTTDVDTWTYWKRENMYHRIVFRNNKVIAILDLK